MCNIAFPSHSFHILKMKQTHVFIAKHLVLVNVIFFVNQKSEGFF